MKKRESPFLCIDQPIYSQNITSPRFEELLPIYSNDNEAEQTIDEALKHKRKIFDSKNFRALKDGYKGESSEDDEYLSSVSDNRYDQESARSRTNSFIRGQRIANNPYLNQSSNRKAHTGLIIDSTFNQQVQGVKSCSKIDKYQSFVKQFELEEVKIRKTVEPQKQKSYQTNELASKRNSGIKAGKVGLNNIWAVKGFTVKLFKVRMEHKLQIKQVYNNKISVEIYLIVENQN